MSTWLGGVVTDLGDRLISRTVSFRTHFLMDGWMDFFTDGLQTHTIVRNIGEVIFIIIWDLLFF